MEFSTEPIVRRLGQLSANVYEIALGLRRWFHRVIPGIWGKQKAKASADPSSLWSLRRLGMTMALSWIEDTGIVDCSVEDGDEKKASHRGMRWPA